jgi:hypothetical protein
MAALILLALQAPHSSLALTTQQQQQQAPPTPHSLHIDYEPSEALAVAPGMVLGWAVPPHAPAPQASFRVRLSSGGGAGGGPSASEFDCRLPLNCSRSDGVALELLTGHQLPPSTTFEAKVQLLSTTGQVGGWSAPFRFSTALRSDGGGAGWRGAVPVWALNASQNFVLLRRSFILPGAASEHLLHITAHGVPNRKSGESFLRVHWVAVPDALRARRVNRRRRERHQAAVRLQALGERRSAVCGPGAAHR